jgi:lysophospholipase L1-like esterase
VRNEVAAPYAINAQGWNSGIGDYRLDKSPGTFRIAVVGDSFVEALQVAHDRSLGERLAAELARDGRPVEVLRFGISGAPMSQYLNMIEREVTPYRPDAIVVLIVHNDFDESFEFVPGRYTSSFLKLRIENGRVVGEIPPAAWTATSADWLRHTATARFFYYRWQIGPESLKNLLIGSARADTGGFSANVDTSKIAALRADMTAAADYTFGRMADAAQAMGALLVIAMDGDRGAIYAGDANPLALVLNGIAGEAAKRRGIRFIDLHPVFAADWQANRLRFDFASDGHWNEHGHAVAAKAIAQALDARP